MFKTILICSDGSEHSLRAIHVAADLAGRYEAELVLLTTSETSGTAGQSYTGLQLSNQIDSMLEARSTQRSRVIKARAPPPMAAFWCRSCC